MKKIIPLLFLAVNLLHAGDAIAADKILDASMFIKSSDRDVAVGLYRLMQEAKSGGYHVIKIPKGIYHVYADHAFEKYMYISNHDCGNRRVAIPIIDFNGLMLDGQGAKFIMHGLVIPIAIEDSKNITISNMEFNYERPTHSELKVVAVDDNNGTIDFSIANEYPYEIRDGQINFIKYGGFEHNLENAVYWDPKTRAVAYQSRALTPLGKTPKKSIIFNQDKIDTLYSLDSMSPGYRYRGLDNNYFVQQLKPGLIRVSGVKTKLPEPGWILVAKGLNGYNRMAPGIRLLGNENTTVQHITVHHASGMGLIAEDCTNVTLESFFVNTDKNDDRMLSTTADATHFVACRGEVKMRNCRFENQLDDATNIHGTYMQVIDTDKKSIGAGIGHFQQSGFRFGRKGDTVVAVNPKISAVPLFRLTINNVEVINARYYKIHFNEDVSKIPAGYYIENVSAYPTVDIRDCEFVNNRARGLLLLTPKHILIENNTFSNQMSSILCPNEFTFWYESGFVKDLVIRNNKFLDATYGDSRNLPIINIQAVSKNGEFIHDNILIENNTFTNFSSFILSAEYLNKITFRNNSIAYSGNYPIISALPVVKLKAVNTAVVTDNKYDQRFKNFIEKASDVNYISTDGNKAINKAEMR